MHTIGTFLKLTLFALERVLCVSVTNMHRNCIHMWWMFLMFCVVALYVCNTGSDPVAGVMWLSLQVCVVSFGASFIYYHTTRKWARKWSDPWHWKREGKGLFGEVHAYVGACKVVLNLCKTATCGPVHHICLL